MLAASRPLRSTAHVSAPVRRRSEPKSLALLVDVVLARYGILPLAPAQSPQPAAPPPAKSPRARRGEQTLLFPLS